MNIYIKYYTIDDSWDYKWKSFAPFQVEMGTDDGVKASGGWSIPTAVRSWLGSTRPVWSKSQKTWVTRSHFSLSLFLEFGHGKGYLWPHWVVRRQREWFGQGGRWWMAKTPIWCPPSLPPSNPSHFGTGMVPNDCREVSVDPNRGPGEGMGEGNEWAGSCDVMSTVAVLVMASSHVTIWQRSVLLGVLGPYILPPGC